MQNAGGFFICLKEQSYIELEQLAKQQGLRMSALAGKLLFSYEEKQLQLFVAGEALQLEDAGDACIVHYDQCLRVPEKIIALVLSRLKLNKIIFARNCEVRKTDKATGAEFLGTYHLMNSTQCAYCLGLYYKNELIALATFSKGRKMQHLPAEQRSFELIRFCCKSGITVAGGLTRLIKNFCELKNAGDVMTYVDRQLSDGKAFIKSGFKKLGETEPNYFLVNRQNFERIPATKAQEFDHKKFYLSHTAGNIKLVYTP